MATAQYVFVEKLGPFQDTAQACWQELQKVLPELKKKYKVKAVAALYKVAPKMIYRAGIMIEGAAGDLPSGLHAEKFSGGSYTRFVLNGPYGQLPQASGRVFEIVKKTAMPLRDGYFVEHYVNDPCTTPEAQLITEILVPTE